MDAVLTTMVEDRIGPGEHTQFLIHTAKEIIGFDYCLALRSPVFALQLALEALLSRDGDDVDNVDGFKSDIDTVNEKGSRGKGVIISALSPLYYERVIRGLGLIPLYCDTSDDSPLMAEEKIHALMAAKPLCIIFHHTLGYLPEAEMLAGLGKSLPVIEDCSQSVWTVLKEKKAGTFGTLAVLGLEEKDMITAGGGALLFAANRRDAALLRSLGELPPEYLLPDLNAAMAAVQFREGEKNLARRRELAGVYVEASLHTRHKRFRESEGLEYNNYAFSLVLESGVKDVKAYAKRKEIAVEQAFDSTLAGSGAIPSAQCPSASSLALRTVFFPLYPRLGAQAADRVTKLIMALP